MEYLHWDVSFGAGKGRYWRKKFWKTGLIIGNKCRLENLTVVGKTKSS